MAASGKHAIKNAVETFRFILGEMETLCDDY